MKQLLVIIFALLITACGFHLRSPADFPSELHYVYFTSVAPYSSLSAEMRALLKSMNVVLTKNKNEAPYTIHISEDAFTDTRPAVIDATLPTTIAFTKTACINIIDNHTKKIILTRTLSPSASITLNANQIYSDNANDMIKQTLNRELISLIYYWLVS